MIRTVALSAVVVGCALWGVAQTPETESGTRDADPAPAGGPPYALRVDRADVTVRFSARLDTPEVSAFTVPAEAAAAVSVRLQIASDGGRIVASRPTEIPPERRLRISVVVPATAGVSVEGSQLRVDAAPSVDDQLEEHGDAPLMPLHLLLDSSDVVASGIGPVAVQATATTITLDGCRGDVRVGLSDGDLRVVGHTGRLTTELAMSRFHLEDHTGRVEFHLAGGALTGIGAEGEVVGTADDATVELDSIRGKVVAEGSRSTVIVRGTSGSQVQLSGRELTIFVEDCGADLLLTMVMGSADVQEVGGRVLVDARDGAEVELEQLGRGAAVILRSSAGLRVTGAPDGTIQGNVEDAVVELEEVAWVDLAASRSEVVLRDVAQIKRMDLVDSTLSGWLPRLHGNPAVKLSGVSEAMLDVPMPCRVRVAGPGARGASSAVSVSGCDLHSTGRTWGPASRGRPVLNLTATVGADSRLTVNGAL